MKHIMVLLAWMIPLSVMHAQELDKKFVEFRDFCFTAREAFQQQSVDSLADCVIYLDSKNKASTDSWGIWSKLKAENEADSTSFAGHLLIDVMWMDSLVETWSEKTVPIDKSTRIRGKGLQYTNKLVAANSTQKFTARGRGVMTVVVIAEDGTDIKLTVDHPSCNYHYESEAPAHNGCQYATWQAQPAPTPLTPYEILVTNPSDHDIVCVFATD